MKKIFVTGASGLLGSNFAHIASKSYEVYAAYNTHPIQIKGCSCVKLDITNQKEVSSTFDKIKPDLIIHCAANTDVDYCEKNHADAWAQNVGGTENIAKIAKKNNVCIIYISTDSVYDGTDGNYTEESPTNPVNYYAKTKLEGERILQKYNPKYIIARTNIYGWSLLNKNSFAEWIINSLNARKNITLFNDVYFSPILINNLIEVLLDLYKKEMFGTYNITGTERVNKLQFGMKTAKIFGLDSKYIEPIKLDDKNLFAPRPKDTSLNVNKVSAITEIKLLNISDGLTSMKKLIDTGYVMNLKEALEEFK